MCETSDNVTDLIVVILSAILGGIFFLLIQGIQIKMTESCKKRFKSDKEYLVNYKSIFGSNIRIPLLVGMIIMGCVGRNVFLYGKYKNTVPEGEKVQDCFSDQWASWIRQCCLSVILMVGGMEVTFKGKSVTVVLLTLCP